MNIIPMMMTSLQHHGNHEAIWKQTVWVYNAGLWTIIIITVITTYMHHIFTWFLTGVVFVWI